MSEFNASLEKHNAWHNPDPLLIQIADYVSDYKITERLAFETAKYCLLDSLGCAMLALLKPQCRKLLGPWVSGSTVPLGSRVPGTNFVLDPVKAAFDIGTLIRWLDFNDTWLAAEWGHPSDNLGAILAVADHITQRQQKEGKAPLTLQDVFIAMIKAYEIQGVLALQNAFNRVGLDHVVLVKIASTAVACSLMGAAPDQIVSALSNAWVDGQSLRAYRHVPNTGPRKSWAAGDATSRAVRLATMTVAGGEPGCPQGLSAKTWGFCDALFDSKPIQVARPFGSYVMENILYKVRYPAEFHGQTAVECGMALHDEVKHRIHEIERVEIQTQEPAIRIIHKLGTLHNEADRDHCLEYMTAVALLFGELESKHYSDEFAKAHPEIDALRKKMIVRENTSYSQDYLDLNKRAIPNSLQVFFKDGTETARMEIHYPLGHRNRREEALPHLREKYERAVLAYYGEGSKAETLLELWAVPLEVMSLVSVETFMGLWAL